MASSFEAVTLNHIARETLDVKALAKFYEELFGLERAEVPKEFGDTAIWLKFPPAHYLHIIQKKEGSKLPESPLTVPPDAKQIESDLPQGHHLAFRVGDYDAAIETLKKKGISYYEKTQQAGSIRQCFFFDPEGQDLTEELQRPFNCSWKIH